MTSQIGKMIHTHTAPAHTYAIGRLKKGQVLRIVDVDGQQVVDFVTLKLDDPTEYLDCVYTNWMLGRYKWHKGDAIYSNHLNPLWTIIDDTVDDHYTGGGFCSRDARIKFQVDDQKGCRDTLEDAFSANGISPQHLRSVSCFNIFMNVAYTPDGRWEIGVPKSKAGDYIDLRAEMDVFWASSVCFWPAVVNGAKPSPLRFESYDGDAASATAATANPVEGRQA